MTGTRPPRMSAFMEWGSWIGGDRDGNPNVTAAITRETLRIQADHVLRGYEAVVHRLSQTIAATATAGGLGPGFRAQLARDERDLPETAADVRRRFPEEPYRQRLAFIEERLRRTRRHLVDGAADRRAAFASPAGVHRRARRAPAMRSWRRVWRASRMATCSDLRWQVETFGFHALSLEVRQHSDVHRRALELLREAGVRTARCPIGARRRPSCRAELLAREASPGVPLGEVLGTFRAIARHPGHVRRGRLPPLRRQLHARRARTSSTSCDWRPIAGGPRGARRGAPVRVGRRARGLRGRSWTGCCRTPATGEHLEPTRRQPGGDARLLRLDQGVGHRSRPPGCSTGPRNGWRTSLGGTACG